MCPGGQKGQLYPVVHQAQRSQLVKRSDVALYTALVRPHLEYYVQYWDQQKMVKGLVGMTYEEWLRRLGLFSLVKRLRDDLIAVYSSLMRGRGDRGTDLFSLVYDNRMQGNGLKLCQGKFRLDIRKKFFTEGVEQASQGSVHGTKSVHVQEAFGQHF